jgi:hypothetical protein
MRPLFAAAGCALLGLAMGCSRPAPTTPAGAVAATLQAAVDAWLGKPVAIRAPAAVGARYPNLAVSPDGRTIVMSWLEPGRSGGEFALRFAQWHDDQRWGAAVTVAASKDWFVNWADFPSVVPADDERWTAHWLQQKRGDVYAYDAMVTLSTDAGRTWSPGRPLNADGTATEHGFVSLTQAAGRPYAIWLDGRKTTGEGHAHAADEPGSGDGAMTLRGAGLQANGANSDETEIDARVCDCCQTDVATTRDGLIAVYRDRSDDEVRNVVAVRFVAGRWSAPVVVHADDWRIDACPVNGPAIAAQGDSVAVAWFTAPDQSRVRLAFSSDGGRTFAAPLEVASGKVVGRVDVVLLPNGRAIVSWLGEGATGTSIRAQPFTRAGPAAPAFDVVTTDIARSSGFPQMLPVAGGLLFAWTATGTDAGVRTVFAPLD